MDSSPDLSLKLRRGSSDSRDTFYMDFAQGIDSDIEEVDNSAIKRAPQQPPTPPPTSGEVLDMDLPTSSVIPPPPLPSMLQHQPLPTLSEQDARKSSERRATHVLTMLVYCAERKQNVACLARITSHDDVRIAMPCASWSPKLNAYFAIECRRSRNV